MVPATGTAGERLGSALGSRRTDSGQEHQGIFLGCEAGVGAPLKVPRVPGEGGTGRYAFVIIGRLSGVTNTFGNR